MERPSEQSLKAFGIIDEDKKSFHQLWASDITYFPGNLGIRTVYEDNGIAHIDIVIDSNTGIREIEDHWGKIKNARERLIEKQGPDLYDYFREILRVRRYSKYLKGFNGMTFKEGFVNSAVFSKPSYPELTLDVNFDLLVFMVGIFKEQPDSDELKLARLLTSNLLWNFGWSDNEMQLLINHSKSKLALEICPWDISKYPITRIQMKDKITFLEKTFRGESKYLKLSEPKRNLDVVYKYFIIRGDWITASELLKKTYPKVYAKYEGRFSVRTADII